MFCVPSLYWEVCYTYYYSVNNVPLSHVDKVRDLGIIVDSSLKFDKHISLIVHKAMNRSRLILKCFHSRDRVLLTIAFRTYVRPILEYCSAVWSHYFKYLITKIEHVCSEIFYKKTERLLEHAIWTAVEHSILESLEHRRKLIIHCFLHLTVMG